MAASKADDQAERDLDRRIGEKLKELRVERGLSQDELGARLHVNYVTIHRYEKGFRISAPRLKRIADVFGVPMAYFFEAESELTAAMQANTRLRILEARTFQNLGEFPEIQQALIALERAIGAADLHRHAKPKDKK